MAFRTKANPANDFGMNIMDSPPRIEDFNFLGFPNISNVWAENTNQQVELLVNQYLRDFDDIQSFVKSQISSGRISFIQVSPSFDPSNDHHCHYICFGGDPYSLEDHTVSFRIDQDRSDFKFPQILNGDTAAYLKTISPGLSGAIIGPLEFPSIMLSGAWIGKPEICYGYRDLGRKNIAISNSIKKEIGNYYFVASDYWSVATVVDKYGKSWLCNGTNKLDFEIKSTGMSIKEWYQAELHNPFRQRPKPDWLQKKNA